MVSVYIKTKHEKELVNMNKEEFRGEREFVRENNKKPPVKGIFRIKFSFQKQAKA